MAKQFPEPELPSARRWSHGSLASNLTDDSGYQDPDEYQLQTFADLMLRGHAKSSNLTPKPKSKPKLKPLINTPKNLHDRMLDLKNDVPDSVQSTALPTNFATQSLSDAGILYQRHVPAVDCTKLDAAGQPRIPSAFLVLLWAT
jgi:hypothetical protein